MNWSDLVPLDVAEHKAAWDKRHAIRRAAEAGIMHKDIAEAIGVSAQRVWQHVQKAKREVEQGRRDPIERYLSRKDSTRLLSDRVFWKLSKPNALASVMASLVGD